MDQGGELLEEGGGEVIEEGSRVSGGEEIELPPETPRETALRLLTCCPRCGLALGQLITVAEWRARTALDPSKDCWNTGNKHTWAGVYRRVGNGGTDMFAVMDFATPNYQDSNSLRKRAKLLWKKYNLPGEPNSGSGF